MRFISLTSKEEIDKLIDWHNKNSEYVVMDTETTDKSPHKAELVDIQISGQKDGWVYVFPAKFVECLKNLKSNLVFHNYKYDLMVLYRYGVDLRSNYIWDTMFMSHLLDENRESHSLSSWVKELWQDNYKEEFWAKYKHYLDAPHHDRMEYSCKDIFYTEKLVKHLFIELKKQDIPNSLIDQTHRFSKALFDTELLGIGVDLEYLTNLGVSLRSQIETLKPKMRSTVEMLVKKIEMDMWAAELDKRKTDKGKANVKKPEFSFDSSKQLIELLYNNLGIERQFNEKTKSISVDFDSLEKIRDSHPIVPLIIEYRTLNKVYTSFIEGTLDRVREGRVYPRFHEIGTATGRTSSSDPNLQQLPATGGIRGIYVPTPGNVLISADYGQLEVCLAAHFSQDKNLLKIVLEGASQHDITAEAIFSGYKSLSKEDEKRKALRAQAKTLNFAMQYRCSSFKVGKILGLDNVSAERVYEKYWDTYSGLRSLMAKCDRRVDKGEPIINPFGRRRRFEVKKRMPWDKAYRQAFNALIQGTGADLTNRAFYLIDKELRERGFGKGLFVVHDEVLVEVKKGLDKEAGEVISSIMEGVGREINLTVPLKVEVSEGMDRWED